MVLNKSLDEVNIIAALIHDVGKRHGLVFNTRAERLTISKLRRRFEKEGLGFLTKTLPRLGKAFDKAIAGNTPLNAVDLGFDPMPNSKLPRFLGELFSEVLQPNGELLPHPCAECVKSLRLLLYPFYKYNLPHTDEQEQQVISRFKQTESDLSDLHQRFQELETRVTDSHLDGYRRNSFASDQTQVTRVAKMLLAELFRNFDPTDIKPRHGPGAVATKQRLAEKYRWTNIAERIRSVYPADEYFFVNLRHISDRLDEFCLVDQVNLPAKVILVPKDSRGPRLISCEPVDFQWVQQGLGTAIVRLVEKHPLTKWNVNFTDQSPNRRGALLGSKTGRYSTLDLNEASDRVSVDLVRLLFPKDLCRYLEACRTSSTVLPSGEELPLNKYAPMGSCLCFPILALTVWAILTAAAPDADTREGVLVYGDDVIVPAGYTANAIEQLESFGLRINRDKSCTSGLFRESCGMDAFNGVDVTPVRFRTVWSSAPRPDVYCSYVAYANALYDRQCFTTYDLIVRELLQVYGSIPEETQTKSAPFLRDTSGYNRNVRRRWNKNLQKFEFLVWTLRSRSVTKVIDGWSMLLRFFAETGRELSPYDPDRIVRNEEWDKLFREPDPAFSVSQYTSRRTSMLVRRWR